MHKSTLLALGALAITAGSCAKSEIISSRAESGSNEIVFSAKSDCATKAQSITTTTLKGFTVSALKGTETFFENVDFKAVSAGIFNSTDKYYWPGDEELDFYATAPEATAAGDQITKVNETTYRIEPSSDPASQIDFIFCNVKSGKPENSNYLALNFKHAESKINSVIFKNTSKTLDFTIKGFKVCGLADSGVFTYTGVGEDGFLKASDWNTEGCGSTEYVSTYETPVTLNHGGSTRNMMSDKYSMVVIPQTCSKAEAYGSDGKLDGAYIAVLLSAKTSNDGTYVIGDANNDVWCCWPVDISFTPGTSYRFSVDVSTGGYKEGGPDGGDPESTLDDSNVIMFASVAVTAWDSAAQTVLDKYNGREHVDLGLPSGIQWSTMNVGATAPEGFGLYYAWGDTKGYRWQEYHTFGTSTYKWWDTNALRFTKYNEEDGKTILDLSDDAARKAWGGGWRVPSYADMEELAANTYHPGCKLNGTWGIAFFKTKDDADKGKKENPVAEYDLASDVCIFIPYMGYILNDVLWHDGEYATLWLSTVGSNVRFSSSTVNYNTFTVQYPRVVGLPVRAVVD